MKAFLYFLLKMIGIDMDVQARGYRTPTLHKHGMVEESVVFSIGGQEYDADAVDDDADQGY